MKKSLLDPQCSTATAQRIMAIIPEQVPRWGSMDAAKMLQHCGIVNTAILSENPATRQPTTKERILKTLFLYLIKRLPKNAKQPARIREAAKQLPAPSFEDARSKLIASLADFLQHPRPMANTHPVFGPMNTKEWGMFAWMHLNHHLSQFGF